jgi:hypothetical protein
LQKKTTSQNSQKHEKESVLLQGDFALLSCAGDKSNRFFVVKVTVVNANYDEMTFIRKKETIMVTSLHFAQKKINI